MANLCYFKMNVQSKNKDNIKKFINCFYYKENIPKFTTAKTQLTNISKIKKYNDSYNCIINGECNFSLDISMTDLNNLSYINRKNYFSDQKKLKTINYLCKLNKVNAEIIGNSLEDGIHEHLYINELGKILIYEHSTLTKDKDGYFKNGQFIYQEVLDNGNNTETKIKNNYLYYFLLNKYEQKKNIIALFINEWAPYNYFYTNPVFAKNIVTKEELIKLFDINEISKNDYIIALSKGHNKILLEKILKNNTSLLDSESLFKELLKNDYSIIDIIPDNYKIKYENIINDVYQTKQAEIEKILNSLSDDLQF